MNTDQPTKAIVEISTQIIIRVVLVVIGLFVLYKIKNIVLIILTAIVIASFIEHVVLRLEKKKIPRTVTVVGIYVLLISVFTALGYFLIPILVQEVSSVVDLIGKLFAKSNLADSLPLNTIADTKTFFEQISGGASQAEFIKSTQIFLGKVTTGVGSTVGNIFGGVFNVIMIFIISFYLSIQQKGIENFLRIVTPIKSEEYVISLWNRTERKIALWIRGQLLLGLIVGITIGIGLAIMGVKYAFLIALIAGISELIPFGLILAFIPAIAIAYSDGSLALAGWTLLLFAVVQQIENYVLVPIITKKSVGIPALVVILSLFIGGALGGFWGVLLAIPAVVLLLEYVSDVEKTKTSARYIKEGSDKRISHF